MNATTEQLVNAALALPDADRVELIEALLASLQGAECQRLVARHGFRLSAIGSPIGKVKIDAPFGPHLQRFRRAIELCKVFETPNIRIFSYYLPDGGTWERWRRDVMDRMADKA